jgi:hypothetical protein
MSRKRVTQKHLASLPLEARLNHWLHGDDFDPRVGALVSLCRTLFDLKDRAKTSEPESETMKKIIRLVGQGVIERVMLVVLRSIHRRDGRWLKQLARAAEQNGPADPVPLLIYSHLFGRNDAKELVQQHFPTRLELQCFLEGKGHRIALPNLTRLSREMGFRFKRGPDRSRAQGIN